MSLPRPYHTPEVLGQSRPFVLIEPEFANDFLSHIARHNVQVLRRPGPGSLLKVEFPELTITQARNLMVLIELRSN